jgi:hypothetical protein
MTTTPICLLADDVSSSSSSLYFWSAVLVIVVTVLFVALYFVRRALHVDQDVHGEGFTLGDLRRMQKDGQLSAEEFDRAKAKMVASMHAAQARSEAAKAEAAKRGTL